MATGLVEYVSTRGRSAELQSMETLLNVAVSSNDARLQLRQTYEKMVSELQSLREEVKMQKKEILAAKKPKRKKSFSTNTEKVCPTFGVKRAYNFSAGPASIPIEPLR